MSFLTFIRANVCFTEREFDWKTYTAAEVLTVTKRVEIINKKEFVAMALNADDAIFIVNVAVLIEPTIMLIHPSYQAQVASLTSKETEIPVEYFHFSNVFSSDAAAKLLEYTGIDYYPINLLDDKQAP